MFIVNTTYLECRNYVIRYDFNADDIISLNLLKLHDEQPVSNKQYTDYFNRYVTAHNGVSHSSYFLQDSEFNSNHWFNPAELAYINRN